MNRELKAGTGKGWQEGLLFAVALIPPTLWATSIIAAKVVVGSLPPLTSAAIRFLMAAAIMWGLRASLPGPWQRPQGRDWIWLALTGFFQSSLYFAFQYAGVEYTSAGNASIIVNIRPIFVAILALFLLNERRRNNGSTLVLRNRQGARSRIRRSPGSRPGFRLAGRRYSCQVQNADDHDH